MNVIIDVAFNIIIIRTYQGYFDHKLLWQYANKTVNFRTPFQLLAAGYSISINSCFSSFQGLISIWPYKNDFQNKNVNITYQKKTPMSTTSEELNFSAADVLIKIL